MAAKTKWGMTTLMAFDPKTIQKPGILAAILAIMLSGASAQHATIHTNQSLDGIIGSFVQAPTIDRPTVERLLGTTLSLGQKEWVYRYTADDIELKDATIERVDYSEDVTGKTGINSLVLRIRGKCFSNREILEEYPSLKLKVRPSLHSQDPQAGWAEEVGWGELLFGFDTVDPPYCLRFIAMRTRPGTPKPSGE